MANQNMIWISIELDALSDKIRDYADKGFFREAKDLEYSSKGLGEKLKSLIGQFGGTVHLSITDRYVLEIPITLAEQLNNYLLPLIEQYSAKIAIGIGMDMDEAAKAAKVSAYSGKIELFDNEDEQFKKSEELYLDPSEEFSPNIYDRSNPESPKPEGKDKIKEVPPVKFLDANTAAQLDMAAVQAVLQQLMGPAQQSQQQMQQQMQQQQQQQQQQNPRDLREALHGGQVEGHDPEKAEQEKQAANSEPEEPKQEQPEQADEAEDDSTDKLAGLLGTINDKMPQLMELHDKNPDAFKKILGLVNKVVSMAKDKKAKVEKSEIDGLTDQLNKALKGRYPVGTVHNRKKKVIINGKAVWRSVISGMVKDNQGQAISVKSHNAQADDGTEGVRNE